MPRSRTLATTAIALLTTAAFTPLATARQPEPPQSTVLPLVINWYLLPAEVEPGGTLTAGGDMNTGCTPAGPLTSPGFAEPLRFTRGGNFGRFSGDTRAITTPGTYEVVFQCANRPERSVKTFRILGTPPTTTPPPKPGPKPVVKPKGAPQTGGGTAP
ncbi:hypothetical protein [Lentzea sp. NPDC003310]|uniref:hypothetical protein n=1 Tax=Lentzea sp. NPDC003310 TaxID=3154447 RepID=UPI0033BE7F6A